MAKEDFSGYTEVDPNSHIAVGTRRVTWADLTRGEDAYVYKDKGVDYFDGDFVHHLAIRFTATEANAEGAIWALTNLLDDIRGIDVDSSGDALYLYFVNPSTPDELRIYIRELDGGTVHGSAYFVATLDTTYYLKIVRKESVGTYGTLYLYTYSDPARTTLLSTKSVTLNTSKKDYRYIHAVQTWNAATSQYATSGYAEDLELFDVLTGELELANMTLTDIADTTVTGNAVIVNTGLSAVTAHGHCWATTIDPTTADSKVDNGAGTLGVYSSAITGLIAGQQYYIRAYATNTEGTAYGPNIQYIAGRGGTQRFIREIGITDDEVRFIGTDGKEYKLTGTAV